MQVYKTGEISKLLYYSEEGKPDGKEAKESKH